MNIIRGLVGVAAASGLVLVGSVAGVTLTAQADGPRCGQTVNALAGDYWGSSFRQLSRATGGVVLTLNADGTADGLNIGPAVWQIEDSSVRITFPDISHEPIVLVPGCAGAKLRPETLIGGTENSATATYVLHRNV